MPTDAQRNKRLERCQLKVLFQVPFFSPGVAKLPVVWDSSIVCPNTGQPTACTNGKEIRWNPADFDAADDQTNVTTLCHEVLHPLLGHLWRLPPGADPEVWNHATDYAINGMLRDFARELTSKGLADPFPMPKDQGWLVNDSFRDMSEEQIYTILANRPPGGGSGSPQGASGSPGGKSGQPGKQNAASGQGGANPSKAAGSPGRSQGHFIPQKPDEPSSKKSQQDWEGTFCQSVAAAKGRGNLPGSITQMLADMLNPKIPWQELLRSFIREQAAEDWDWMQPNPVFDGADFIMPTLRSEKLGEVCFAVDTSGSIDTELLKQFKGEMQAVLDDMKAPRIREICCDTQIQADRIIRQGERVPMDAPGRGGTSFVPIFDLLADNPPKALVILTDLDGTMPSSEPQYPVIWVVYGTQAKAPFGETVYA